MSQIISYLCLIFCSSTLCFIFASGYELPTGIQKCKYTDDTCLMNSMQYVLKNFGKAGIKGLGLTTLDPLHIKKFSLAKNLNSPVSIDMIFTEVDLIGLQDSQIKRAGGLNKDLSKPLIVEAIAPKVILKGPYSIEGKVLILPIVGEGKGQFTLKDLHYTAKIKMEEVKDANGVNHIEVSNIQLLLNPSRVIYKLEGLFNGQKELSDNMHAVINENWQDVFNELKSDISEALSLVFKHVINHVFAKHSTSDLFLDA